MELGQTAAFAGVETNTEAIKEKARALTNKRNFMILLFLAVFEPYL
jgi:hypothetical protein